MNRGDINIRDPYVLVSGEKYYLYGTCSATCWGAAESFECYVSGDLENWDGPIEIFRRPEGFWADRSYWAPECYELDGRFYLVTTLGGEGVKKGVHVLTADSPTGPFVWLARLTPEDWCCIDGTLYRGKDGRTWLIFSHSFEDDGCQDMCAVELKADLSGPSGEPFTLFRACEAAWAVPVPFAKAEFGLDGDVYFTDGPCAVDMENGALGIIWSAWGANGYAVGVAVSENGIAGPWRQVEKPMVPGGAGHGMLFTALDGRRYYAFHSPNDKYMERPVFREVAEKNGTFELL